MDDKIEESNEVRITRLEAKVEALERLVDFRLKEIERKLALVMQHLSTQDWGKAEAKRARKELEAVLQQMHTLIPPKDG